MNKAPLKIIALEAENLKRLRVVQIRPDGAVVQITGRNGQGKSSVLDAIWWALGGGSNIQAQPIRKGEERAVVRVDLGEIIVTRKFRAKDGGGYTTELIVEGADGGRFSSPQAVLDALIGGLAFDPLAFSRLAQKAKVEALRALVPDVDFAAVERENAKDYTARTDRKRDADRLAAQAQGIVVPELASRPAPDIPALEDQFATAGEENARIERMTAQARDRAAAIEEIKERIARDQKALAAREADAAAAHPIPRPIDVTALREQLAQARLIAAARAKAEQRASLAEDAKIAQAEADRLTAQIEARRRKMRADVAAAQIPVEGLELEDNGVTLNGAPFEQASDAEQLQASIAIAAAMSPRLRVIRVRDGSLLDDDAMVALAAYAEAHELQVWIERVDSSGRVGFVLEDGAIVPTEPAESI